ncbi:DUF3080 family protein [Neiella sp. HB171785]|uniref:DUF3080 family protein n=1 Tax=Neiella litorisoli TaxID=2771431 RepID=A0A8J6QUW2_9GAMM|nr:DUF3080 family protein [Neiella litorisoli]MBD1389578.1 DUF3080 family protein [Neiella litorisoli]
MAAGLNKVLSKITALLALIGAAWWIVISMLRASDSSYLLQNYPQRLARVVAIETGVDGNNDSSAYDEPERNLIALSSRETASAMQAYQLSVRQWWQLKSCDLNDRLAKRNSNLGRVQSPSIRLSYEVDMLLALAHCRKQANEQETIALIDELLAHKRQQVVLLWQHMWLSEPALSKLITPSHTGIPLDQQRLTSELAAIEQALRYLLQASAVIGQLGKEHDSANKALTPTWSATLLEQHLAVLFHSELVPQVLTSQHQAIASLNAASALLAANESLCHAQQHKRLSDRTKSFFGQYYLAKVQPLLSDIKRAGDRLIPLIRQLISSTPPIYQQRFGQVNQHLQFTETVRSHSQHWQRLFANCGIQSAQQLNSR